MSEQLKQKNKRIVWVLIAAAFGMFGFAFAMIPMYKLLCQVTGLNGKFYQIDDLQKTIKMDKDRTISVRFVSNNNELLPWDFHANNPLIEIHPGEVVRVSYFAKNRTIHPMTVQAIPSIVPGIAAKYIHKTECFCFKQQTFAAGEGMDMPILFHIDRDIPKEVKRITVAYTMFDVKMASATNIQKLGRVH